MWFAPEPGQTVVDSQDTALVDGLLAGERRLLAKAITLIESTRPEHRQRAQKLLDAILPHTGRSMRVGISGVPGVGKSTFIEALGMYLIDAGHRVAVLAVDPSSTIHGGSILGDKTRMELLSQRTEAFIRPSPSSSCRHSVSPAAMPSRNRRNTCLRPGRVRLPVDSFMRPRPR